MKAGKWGYGLGKRQHSRRRTLVKNGLASWVCFYKPITIAIAKAGL